MAAPREDDRLIGVALPIMPTVPFLLLAGFGSSAAPAARAGSARKRRVTYGTMSCGAVNGI